MKDKPIKINHFSTTYNATFLPELYLTDYFPGKVIKKKHLSLREDITREDLEAKLQELGYKLFHKSLYSNEERNVFLHTGQDISEITRSGGSLSSITYGGAPNLDFTYTEDVDMDQLVKSFEDMLPKSNKLAKFNLISTGGRGISTISKSLSEEIKLDFPSSYNTEVDLETIKADLNSSKSGLILYTGDPGTGKSTLIKYLAQELTDKRFFFLNNSNLDILSDTNFLEYCLNNMKGAVLILEDCERALLAREGRNNDISTILNVTDGIMGDILNLKIIATLNTHDNIDEALLRKGRLIRRIHFEKLSVEQAVQVRDSIGQDFEITEPIRLCEVYNPESNGVEAKVVKERQIGFRN